MQAQLDKTLSAGRSLKLSRAVTLGMQQGSIAFFTCGVLEIWLIAILPWFLTPRESYRPFDIFWTAVLLVAYAAAGALIGAICAAWLYYLSSRFRTSDPVTRSTVLWAVLSFVLLLILESNNYFGGGQVVSEGRPVLSKALLVLGIGGVVVSLRLPVLRFLVYPVIAAALYVGPLAVFDTLVTEGYGKRGAYAGVILTVALALAAGFCAHRFRNRLPSPLVALALLAAAGLGISALMKPGLVLHPSLSSKPVAGKPNVILIVMDTVRASQLSVYGYSRKTSPNLEKFASGATRFANLSAAGDWTLPSHASMFTGMYVRRHGAHNQKNFEARPLSPKADTLAELLSKRGFATAAVVSNAAAVSKSFNLDQGFEHFDQAWNRWAIGWYATWSYTLRATVSRFRSVMPPELYSDCRPAGLINAAAINLIDDFRTRKQPFFLFLNYMDAHIPYVSSGAFVHDYGPRGSLFSPQRFRQMKTGLHRGRRPADPKEMKGLVARYDAGISTLDQELGKLFEYLRKTGVYDNTLIVITADHGEAFGEHGTMEHGGASVYQDQVHVPLIIKYPDDNERRVVRSPVSHVDLAPTVLDTLGYGVPGNMDGISLRRMDESESRTVFSEMYPHAWSARSGSERFRYSRQAAFAGDRKLIWSANGMRELYDLSADPAEKHNLIGQELSRGAELESKLREWRNSGSVVAPATEKVSPAALEKLKSLGYVQGK